MNETGEIIVEETERIETWKKYIEKLFNDNRTEDTNEECTTGPDITTEEVEKVIKEVKDGKSPGPDGVHGEILKLLDSKGVKRITSLFNEIYNTGQIPEDWLRS